MRLSVIVPVHNGARFIDSCVSTVRSQAQVRQLIFVDDGSTDGTSAAIEQLPRYPMLEVSLLHQPRRGPASARNTGLNAATGEGIAFLDVDDLWEPEALRHACSELEQDQALEIVQGRVRLALAGPGHIQPHLVTPHYRVNLGSFVFRRGVVEQDGYFDEQLASSEDLDFIARLRQRGAKLRRHPAVFLQYRLHEENMTKGKSVAELGMFDALHRSLQRRRAT